MSELRQTPLHRSLHRPSLFLGGERELVLTSLLLCFGVAIAAVNMVALSVGTVMWGLSLALLRMMASADPNMSRVYQRQLKYRTYYPPRARPYRTE